MTFVLCYSQSLHQRSLLPHDFLRRGGLALSRITLYLSTVQKHMFPIETTIRNASREGKPCGKP
jgi:hypothetical protein